MTAGRRAALHNLGCKVNAYETEAMQQLLEESGYEIVPFEGEADVYVINTCTVTNIADRKSRQMLRRARRRNPSAVIVAAGCYVQTSGTEVEKEGLADIIIGTNQKGQLPVLLEEYFAGRKEKTAETGDAGRKAEEGAAEEEEETVETRAGTGEEKPRVAETGPLYRRTDAGDTTRRAQSSLCAVADLSGETAYEALRIRRTAEHTRAFLKVQDGCNQFCSYCIIPYARGRIRSRAPEEVLEEVKTLAGAGYQEIVLTGIHLSSYGLDFAEEERTQDAPFGHGLQNLITLLNAVPGITRIRLGSLEPRIITREFVQALAACEKICPHFHLSLQSGCDSVLARMNRHYTTQEYLEKCGLLRESFDRPAITTDVIAGFPGETDEEFAETCAFVKRVRFYEMHVFPYSRRAGTRADEMDGQVPESVKKERSHVLLSLAEQMSEAYRQESIGREAEALLEEEEDEEMAGYTREYVRVLFRAGRELAGCQVTGKIACRNGKYILE